MSSRTKITILVIIFILLLAFSIGFFLLDGKGSAAIRRAIPSTSGGTSAETAPVALPREPLGAASVQGQGTVEEKNADLHAFARSFVERFGSYSNQSNFENMEDLYAFMTERMKVATAAFVKTQRQMSQGGSAYRGTTTHVLSVSERSQNSNSATLLLTTQRQESSTGSAGGRLFYQSIELKLVKEGAQWKGDEAIWK